MSHRCVTIMVQAQVHQSSHHWTSRQSTNIREHIALANSLQPIDYIQMKLITTSWPTDYSQMKLITTSWPIVYSQSITAKWFHFKMHMTQSRRLLLEGGHVFTRSFTSSYIKVKVFYKQNRNRKKLEEILDRRKNNSEASTWYLDNFGYLSKIWMWVVRLWY